MNRGGNNYAFIDSQNLNLSIRGQGWRLDFARFRRYLAEKFQVKKAFLFIGYVPRNRDLYAYLKNAGYHLVFKPTIAAAGGIKGNVDAELVLHTMIELENYDHAVIVSGDGDFYCLAKYLLEKGKLGAVIIPNKYRYSSLLRKFWRQLFFLSDLRHLLRKKRP